MAELKQKVHGAIHSASSLFEISEYAGLGYRGHRPRLLVVSFFVLNKSQRETMWAFFGGHAVMYWPLYCATGPFGIKVTSLSVRSTTGKTSLPWKEWLMEAIRIVEPRDLLLLGRFSQIKEFPKRPLRDHRTRGREYEPFVFENLPRRDTEEDRETHIFRWTEAFRSEWEGKMVPHFDNLYFTNVPRVPETGRVNAFAVLTGQKRTAEKKEEQNAKETKLQKIE